MELILFVAGSTYKEQLQTIVRHYLDVYCPSPTSLRVVDVLQQPELARQSGVPFTPTLLQRCPEGEKRVFGDLTDPSVIAQFLQPSSSDTSVFSPEPEPPRT